MNEKGHRARLRLFGALSAALMLMIFLFSAQDATDSQHLSDGFLASLIGAFLERILPSLSEKGMGADIRKYAHMAEYFCLGASVLLYLAERTRWRQKGRAALLALAWSFLYACSDEFHQLIVPGRAGRFSDVLVDGVGFGTSIGLALLIWSILESNRQTDKLPRSADGRSGREEYGQASCPGERKK